MGKTMEKQVEVKSVHSHTQFKANNSSTCLRKTALIDITTHNSNIYFLSIHITVWYFKEDQTRVSQYIYI